MCPVCCLQVTLLADDQSPVLAVAPSVGAEKYHCLPPFETLVTTHRSPDMNAAVPSPKPLTVPPPPPEAAMTVQRLPGIHQLFQATTTSGSTATGTGNSLSPTAQAEAAMSYMVNLLQLLIYFTRKLLYMLNITEPT